MKNIIDKSTIDIISKANIIIFISCIALGLTEYIFQLFFLIDLNISFEELIILLIYSAGFYSILHLIIVVVADIVIICSRLIKNLQLYYLIISTIALAILNLIPFYLSFDSLIKGYIDNTLLILLLSTLVSLIAGLIITKITFNSYKEFIKTSTKFNTLFVSFFLIVIISTIFIVKISFFSNTLVTIYYLFLMLLFYLIIFSSILIPNDFKLFCKIQYKYLIVAAVISILLTGFLFPKNNRLEAYVKKYNFFENKIITFTSALLDFDRDGFGPKYLVGGGDFANFNPKINGYAKDIPENSIDENSFNGDLLKLYYDKPERINKLPIILKDFNVLLITINNLHEKDLNTTDTPFISNLLKNGVYFPNTYSLSNDKITSLKGILSSNFVPIEKFKSSKSVYKHGLPILQNLKSLSYKTHVYLDIPYSAETDDFNIMNYVDVFTANDSNMRNPVNLRLVSSNINSSSNKPFYCWLFLDSKIYSDIDSRLATFFDKLSSIKKFKNTFVLLILLPDSNYLDQPNKPLITPMLIYYSGINPKTVNTKVSSLDVLPTILSLLDKSYNVKSYSGRELGQYLFKNEYPIRPVFSIDSTGTIATLMYNNYKLIYSIKDHYLELYNLSNDSKEKNNIINNNFPERDKMFSLLDFYLSN